MSLLFPVKSLHLCSKILIMPLKSFTLLSFLLLIFTFYSQEVKVKQFDYHKGETPSNIPIGVDENGYVYSYNYVLLIGNSDVHRMRVHDSKNGEIVREINLDLIPGLKNRNIETIDYAFANNQLYVIGEGELGTKEGIYVVRLNHLLQVEGEPYFFPTTSDYCEKRCKQEVLINELATEDSPHHSFISRVYSGKGKKQISELELITFNDENEIIFNRKVKFPKRTVSKVDFFNVGKSIVMQVQSFTRQSEEGNLLGFLFKENVYEDHIYILDGKDNLNELDLNSSFEGYLFEDFNIHENEGEIIVSGKLHKDESFIGLGTLVYDVQSLKLVSSDIHKFDKELAYTYLTDEDNEDVRRRLDKNKVEVNEGDLVTTYKLVRSFKNKNGEIVNIYQNIWSGYTSRSNGQGTVHYMYTNVVMAKINTKGEVGNITFLPFYQMINDVDPEKGFSVFRDGNEFYFLHIATPEKIDVINKVHNNEIDNNFEEGKAIITLTRVDNEGQVSSEGLVYGVEDKIMHNAAFSIGDSETNKFYIVSTSFNPITKKENKLVVIEVETK